MSEASFIAAWRRQLSAGQMGVVLVEADHPLEIYVGATDLGRPLVQIRSTARPKLPEISELVMVTRTHSHGHWILSLSLQDPRFSEVYLRLVAHLVAASRRRPLEVDALRIVDSVLDDWKRLLRLRPEGLLSVDELRGLVGELWLMLNRFVKRLGAERAVLGWLGPLGAPQDFWYEASGYHEVKSVGPSATRVQISSAQQLDELGMELIILEVPQVVETEGGAFNLPILVRQAVDALDTEGSPSAELDVRWRRLGVDVSHPYYADTWFKVTTVETLVVGDGFPAIRQRDLDPGVDHVRFSVDRSAIVPFVTSTERL